MESRIKLAGHAVHPMLVIFPLGLLITSLVFDVMFLVTGRTGLAFVSFAIMAGGVGAGLLASVFGLIDWLAVPRGTQGARGRDLARTHLAGVAGALRRQLGRPLARRRQADRGCDGPVRVGGIVLATISGWLGQELVERLGVGVDPGAHADAPSSLSRERPTPPRPFPPRVVPFPRERQT